MSIDHTDPNYLNVLLAAVATVAPERMGAEMHDSRYGARVIFTLVEQLPGFDQPALAFHADIADWEAIYPMLMAAQADGCTLYSFGMLNPGAWRVTLEDGHRIFIGVGPTLSAAFAEAFVEFYKEHNEKN